jgi:hypothetical protein
VVFSKWSIRQVKVTIDSQLLGLARVAVDHPNLYVLPWNASVYHDGHLHQISVEIEVTERENFVVIRSV